MNFLNIIYGAIIGVANIIPGVSGGTVAVILNVYDKIINSIANIKKDFKKSFMFLAQIGIGAIVGIILFANVVDYALTNYNILTNFVFIALIVGTIPMINKKIEQKTASSIISFLISLGVMLSMIFIDVAETNTVIETLTVASGLRLFLSANLSAASMIIPGLSGSFIMLLLGVYTTILTAVSNMNIQILVVVGLGCITGILIGAKVIGKLFEKYQSQTFASILGLMIGSIFVIMPEITLGFEFILGIILVICRILFIIKQGR